MKTFISSLVVASFSVLLASIPFFFIYSGKFFGLYFAVWPFVVCGFAFCIDELVIYFADRIKKYNNKKTFISSVAAIAAVNPEGFTINSKDMTPETAGYCVALAETQNSFNNEGLARVYEVIRSGRANAVGGWLDSESGLYYYDAVVVLQDREKAVELGRLNNQLAIFDLNNMKEVRL